MSSKEHYGRVTLTFMFTQLQDTDDEKEKVK